MSIIDPAQRFSSRVENYVRYRPGYPSEIVEVLKRECNLTSSSIIADVGSGTGFLSRIFLDNGNRVFGIEPNREMREAGERLLQHNNRFTSVDGRAEETRLAGHTVDFVTAGQAAHWFEREPTHREFARILKPQGWIVLVWNDRATDSTPLLREYERLLQTYGTDYHLVHRTGFETAEEVAAFFGHAQVRMKTFTNRQEFDYAGLEGRLLSSSYTPLEGHPSYPPMLAELRRIFGVYQQGGRVSLEYATQMYYGKISI
jgi:SAM-dependent methyltransferase